MFTINDLKSKAPAVFRTAEQGAKDGASGKYLFIPTVDIIDDLSKLGWDIYDVAQQKSKTSPDTTRHMVRFRNKEFGSVGVNGNIPEILFTNSHDRTKSMNFHVGIFRLVCSNGLVIKDKTFGELNLKHNTLMGYSFEDVRTMIQGVTENLPQVMEKIKAFETIEMSIEAARELAIKSFAVRYPEYVNKEGVLDKATLTASVDIDSLLRPIVLRMFQTTCGPFIIVYRRKLLKENTNTSVMTENFVRLDQSKTSCLVWISTRSCGLLRRSLPYENLHFTIRAARFL